MNLSKLAINKLAERGVDLNKMTDIVFSLQSKYNPNITIKDCRKAINSVMKKREVIHTVLTGIAIDESVEKKLLIEPLNSIIFNDYSLYGIDEILALGIVNIYGSIALTTFGYLDKVKPSIIGDIDLEGKGNSHCNTFLDDIVSAIISASCSKIAHKNKA